RLAQAAAPASLGLLPGSRLGAGAGLRILRLPGARRLGRRGYRRFARSRRTMPGGALALTGGRRRGGGSRPGGAAAAGQLGTHIARLLGLWLGKECPSRNVKREQHQTGEQDRADYFVGL